MWLSPYIIEVGWWKEKLRFMSGMGKCFLVFFKFVGDHSISEGSRWVLG
jgi:hypothetical protein